MTTGRGRYTAGPGAGSGSSAPGPGDPGSKAARGTRAGVGKGARLLLLVLLAVGSVQVVFMLGVEGLRLFRSETAITRLEREVQALEEEAAQLEAVIEHADDERYREQLARRQGYMYPDESRVVTGGAFPGEEPE